MVQTELRNLCQKKLPDYMCPTFYEFVEALPLSFSGKIDYRALERKAQKDIL